MPLERKALPGVRAGESDAPGRDFLFRELATPLGRNCQANRAVRRVGGVRFLRKALFRKRTLPPPPNVPPGQVTFQSVNLFRFTWPRRSLLQTHPRPAPVP